MAPLSSLSISIFYIINLHMYKKLKLKGKIEIERELHRDVILKNDKGKTNSAYYLQLIIKFFLINNFIKLTKLNKIYNTFLN